MLAAEDGLGQSQANACAVIPGILSLVEPLKEMWPVLRRDAGASVCDEDLCGQGVFFSAHPDLPAAGRVLHAVFQDIAHSLR